VMVMPPYLLPRFQTEKKSTKALHPLINSSQ